METTMLEVYDPSPHPVLTIMLNDLRLVREAQQRALVEGGTLALGKLLRSVHKGVAEAFWSKLYELSPLRRGQRLSIVWRGDSPLVVARGDPAERQKQRERN